MRDDVDRLLGGLEEDQSTPMPGAPSNWVEDLVQGKAENDALLGAMNTPELTPEKAGRIVKMQMRTGLPEDFISEHLDLVEAESVAAGFDPERFRRENPTLANWLTDPKHAAMARDDVANLQGLEWLFGRWTYVPGSIGMLPVTPVQLQAGAPQKAYGEGERQVALAAARFRQVVGMADDADLARIEDLERQKPRDLGDEGFWAGVPLEAARQLPQLGRTIAGAVGGAAAGAAAGAPFGGVGALPGAILGSRVGASLVAFEQETGNLYGELATVTDDQGRHLDARASKMASLGYGAVASALELWGLHTLLQASPLKNLYRKGMREATAELLKRPTVRRALTRAAREYGGVLSVETSTEAAQEAAAIISGEMARMVSEGDFRGPTAAEALSRTLQAGKAGLQASILLGLPGSVGDAIVGVRQAQMGEVNRKLMTALGETAGASKVRELVPSKYREVVDKVAAAGGAPNVFTRLDAWQTYWQAQGVDPREAYVSAGGTATHYDEAQATASADPRDRPNLVTPTAVWAEKLASTPHHAALMVDSTLFQGGFTPRELEEYEKNAEQAEAETKVLFQAALEEAKATMPEGVEAELVRLYHEQAGATGRTAEGDTNALILRAMVRTAVARWNQAAVAEGRPAETADTLFRGYGITVTDGRPSLTPPSARPAAPVPLATTPAEPATPGTLAPTPAAAAAPVPAAGEGPALPAAPTPAVAPIGSIGSIGSEGGVPTWPARVAQGERLDPMQARERMAELNAVVAAVPEQTLEAPHHQDESRSFIVHKTVSDEGGPWRLTYLTNGEPTGHMVFNSFPEALKEAWYAGADMGRVQDPKLVDPIEALNEVYGAQPAAVEPAPRGLSPGEVVPGAPTQAETFAFSTIDPDRQIPMRYRVVELDSLVTSHDESGQPDPRYPPELQQWNRASAASRGQVEVIGSAASFDNLLVEQHSLDRGAPIIGNGEPFIESGNGRTIGLKKARAADSPAWQRYQEQVVLLAPELGQDVAGMQAPVLIRERTETLTPEERVEFTRDANARAAREPSPVERAKIDAERLTPELIARLPVSEQGTVDDALKGAAGASWMREFLSGMPAGEWGRFVDPSGQVGVHGIAAVKLALFRRVFGDQGERILRSFTEIAGEQKANLEKALFGALPRLATLVGGIQTGAVQPNLDITGDIAQAIDVYRRLKAEGMTVADFLKQGAMFQRELDPFQEQLLEVVAENARRGGRLASMLSAYANAALALPPPSQQALFAAEPVSKAQLWDKAQSGMEPEAPTATLFQDTIESLSEQAELEDALVGYTPSALLEGDERAKAIEEKFAAELRADPEGYAAKYAEIPETMGGKIINADIVKELSEDYQKSPARNTSAVHEPSGTFAKWMFRRQLAKTPVNNTVLLLGGGGGSGKSTALQSEKVAIAAANYDVVVDATLSSYGAARRYIEQSLQSGRDVAVAYVNAPIERAINQVVGRAVRGGPNNGRVVPITAVAHAHFHSQQTIMQLAQDDLPQVSLVVLDNSGGVDNVQAHPVDWLAERSYSSQEEVNRRAAQVYEAEKAAGHVLPEHVKGFERGLEAAGMGREAGRQLEGRDRVREGSEVPQEPGLEPTPSVYEAAAPTQPKTDEQLKAEAEASRTFYQHVFHGTPHLFERFELAKIGTGEGAQVYGWGLYFASIRDVAEHYRQVLSEHVLVDPEGKEVTEDYGEFGRVAFEYLNYAVQTQSSAPYHQARTRLREDLKHTKAALKQSAGLGSRVMGTMNPLLGGLDYFNLSMEKAKLEHAIRVLDEWDERGYQLQRGGKTYKVDIPENDDLLDYDKPLTEQPVAVREKVEGILRSAMIETSPDMTGRQAYDQIETHFAQLWENPPADAARAASAALLAAGVPGLRYLDQASRGQGEGSHNYVIWDESAVEILETYHQRTMDQARGKRGKIQVPSGTGPRQFLIDLFGKADRSTLLHETSHVFLELMGDLAEREDAPPEVKADWQTILRELKVTDRSQIGSDQHEQWARSFEAYMFEGKSPSPELAGAFGRFRAWLVAIYRDIKALQVDVSPDLKRVFDRMLATDEEIARAEAEAVTRPLFPAAAVAGMSPAEYVAYRLLSREAHDQAVRTLERQMLDEAERETRAWWKEAKEQIGDEVEAEVDQLPHRRAEAALRRGTEPDGTALPERIHFDGAELEAKLKSLGLDPLEMRRKFALTWRREGGVHPDVVAERFGFGSGDELVRALLNAPSRSAEIKAEVDARMADRYGDMLQESTKRREGAMEAVHGEARGRLLLTELRALGRKVGQTVPTAEHVVIAFARRLVNGQRVRDLQPIRYQRAEASAARQAEEALALGDFPTALEAKRRQTLNHHLYAEATKAKRAAAEARDYLARMAGEPARRRLGKAGQSYLAQVDELLERFEVKPQTLKALDRRASLREFLDEQSKLGHDVIIPDALLDDAYRKNWKEMTPEELDGLERAVRNIEHLARLKNSLLGRKGRREYQATKAELIEALRANLPDHGPLPLDPETRGAFERGKRLLQVGDASLLKIEELVRRMDGNRVDGPWSEFVFGPIAEAQNAENDLAVKITKRLVEAMEALPKDKRARMLDQRHIERLGQPMTYQAMIAVAFQTGNDSNNQKLLNGRPRGVQNWDPDTIEEILGNLSKEDWQFVQGVWDTLESMWPQIEELEQRLTGVAPPKIKPRGFVRTFQDGTTLELAGGYYPMVYDRRQSKQGRLQADEDVASMFDLGYRRAATPHGWTVERIEGFSAPVKLSMEVLPRHITQVIHDLTHREAVLSVYRILTDREIMVEMQERLGEAYAEVFIPWLKGIANDRNPVEIMGSEFWGNVAGRARGNAAIVAMGFKATTILQNFANVFNALDAVPARHLTTAAADFYRTPDQMMKWVDYIHSRSGEMKHRLDTLERDVRDQTRQLLGKGGLQNAVRRAAFKGIAYTDAAVAYPAWLGAYRHALEQNESEDTAIAHADRQVRLALGAAGAKDLARIQRGNELMKFLTAFYSFFNVLYNRGRAIGYDARTDLAGGRPGLAVFSNVLWRSLLIWLVPAIFSELLSGRGPDDDEEYGHWLARKTLVYPFLTLPLIRNVATSLEGGYDVSFAPAGRVGDEAARSLREVGQLFTGEGDLGDAAASTFQTAGYAFGLPTGQARITGGYLWDVLSGEERPEGVWDFSRGVLYRRKKKGER